MPLRTARKAGDTVSYRDTLGRTENVVINGIAGAAPTAPVPSTNTTGGSLAATTTFGYKLTAVVGGVETAASTQVTQLTGAGATNTVTLTWTAAPVAGATAYKVYGRTNSGPWGFIAEVTGATTVFTDTGSQTPSATVLAPTTTTHVGFRGHDESLRTAVPKATTMKDTNAYFFRY
jgi:hypothetical protein